MKRLLTLLIVSLPASALATEMDSALNLNSSYLGQFAGGDQITAVTVSSMTTSQGQSVYYGETIEGNLRGWAWVWSSASGWTWRMLAGDDLAGVTMTSSLSDGSTRQLLIEDYNQYTSGTHAYYVKAWLPGPTGASSWQPICGYTKFGTPRGAYALRGEWNWSTSGYTTGGGGRAGDEQNKLVFACLDGAMATCVTSGYAPWKSNWFYTPVDGTWVWLDGKAIHETCVRMLRVDYCGAGRSYAHAGHRLDVSDWLYYRISEPVHFYASNAWPFEALWDRGGAAVIGSVASYDHLPSYTFQCPSTFGPTGFSMGRGLFAQSFVGTDPNGEPLGPAYMPPAWDPSMIFGTRYRHQ